MKQNSHKFILGITGRTATGKSTLAAGFAGKGFRLVDADAIYHDLFKNCDEMKEAILNNFGTLDRKRIMEKISKDKKFLQKLNDITHSYVANEIKSQINSNSEKLYVLDVPVPVETGFLDLCDYVITTDCSKELQIERLMERNSYSKEEAMERIKLQMNRDFYKKIADCIVNTENMKPIQIDETIEIILKKL